MLENGKAGVLIAPAFLGINDMSIATRKNSSLRRVHTTLLVPEADLHR